MQEETTTFFSLFFFVFVCFFFPLSIALIRCCGESECQGAPGLCPQPSPAHPLSFTPDLYLSSPPTLTSVESGCFGITLPPPSGPPCALPLPPSSPPLLSCQTNLQLLLLTSTFPVKVLCPHTHARTLPPPLQPFPFFLSTHIAAPKTCTLLQDRAVFPKQVLARFGKDQIVLHHVRKENPENLLFS